MFSVLKRVIGLLFLAAMAMALFVLWQNPAMLRNLVDWVEGMIGVVG